MLKQRVMCKEDGEKKPQDTETSFTRRNTGDAEDAINRLPAELLLSVLSWLDPPALKAAVLVCQVNMYITPSVVR